MLHVSFGNHLYIFAKFPILFNVAVHLPPLLIKFFFKLVDLLSKASLSHSTLIFSHDICTVHGMFVQVFVCLDHSCVGLIKCLGVLSNLLILLDLLLSWFHSGLAFLLSCLCLCLLGFACMFLEPTLSVLLPALNASKKSVAILIINCRIKFTG